MTTHLSLNAWKGLATAVIAILSVLGLYLAIVMKEQANQLWISSGVLFSAGVLLAAGFCHMLPVADEMFEDAEHNDFVWSFAIAGLTTVLLASIEMMVSFTAKSIAERKSAAKVQDEESASAVESTKPSHSDDCCTADLEDESPAPMDSWISVILTIALSIHSIVEGMGLGSMDSVSAVRSAFVAIAIHKIFTAYALGNSLVCSGYWEKGHRKGFYLQAGAFILTTLVGIAIGWIVAEVGHDNHPTAQAVLMGIISGSFIFVAAIEIVPHEMRVLVQSNVKPFLPIFTFIAGYCAMTALALTEGEDHH